MTRAVSVSAAAYQRIKLIASARGVTMGQLVTEAVTRAEQERIAAIVDRLCGKAWPWAVRV